MQKHKHIRIKFWENMLLFISDSCLSCLIPHKLWHKKKKLVRLLNEGRKRIEKELDIVKILKSLRDIKISMKNSLMTPEIKYQISHCEKNFIDIEIDKDESSESEDQEIKNQKKK